MIDKGFRIILKSTNEDLSLSVFRLTIIKSPFKKSNNIYLITVLVPIRIRNIILSKYSATEKPELKLTIRFEKFEQDLVTAETRSTRLLNQPDFVRDLLVINAETFEENNNIFLLLTAVDKIDYHLSTSKNFIKHYVLKTDYNELFNEILQQYKTFGYEYFDTTEKVPPDDNIVLSGLYVDNNITDIQLPTYIVYTYRTHKLPTVYYFDNINTTVEHKDRLIKPIQLGYFLETNIKLDNVPFEVLKRIDVSTYFKNIFDVGQLLILSKDHDISRETIDSNKPNILRVKTPDNIQNARMRFEETLNKLSNIIHVERIRIPNTIFWIFDIGPAYKFFPNEKISRQFINIAYDFLPLNENLYQCQVYGDIILYKKS
jgi:hypothetical protein